MRAAANGPRFNDKITAYNDAMAYVDQTCASAVA